MMRAALARGATGLLALTAAFVAPWTVVPSSGAADHAPSDDLYLVALRAPGTSGYDGGLGVRDYRGAVLAQQDFLLQRVDAPDPVYRWTTALNGFAVRLTGAQVDQLRAAPQVRMVERDTVRRVTGTSTPAPPGAVGDGSGRGGRGVVIGLVDTGVHPGSPVFAYSPELGSRPSGYRGTCEATGRWRRTDCNDKIVGARYFVEGFGADRLRAGADTSPYDDDGHGTQLASLAAGNADVPALDGDQDHGVFSGAAPLARIAAYKACWSAPDPADDGCSSADVVSAIDAAVADGVDVLNLAVAGSPGLDAVDLALLGAAERDVVVAAAAGNDGSEVGHAQPWVTTVGGTTGPRRLGALVLGDGTRLAGAYTATRGVRPTPLVDAATIPAPGSDERDARLCVPGSLDASRAAGRIVVCERGRVGRVDKSAAVRLADGVGMVLVNASGEGLPADFHAVPTLHLGAADGRALRQRLDRGRVVGRLVRTTAPAGKPQVLAVTPSGRTGTGVVKPDLVAPGAQLLAATSPSGSGPRWTLTAGTSAATARVSGWAARVRAAHPDWSAARVRSALLTSATSTAGEPVSLRQGAGLPRPATALDPGLVYDVPATAWRGALDRDTAGRLNLPSVLAAGGTRVVTRRVTNVSGRASYFSSRAWGFTRHRVTVTPAALRMPPGATRTVRIRITPTGAPGAGPGRVDSGWVAWTRSDGTRARIPVVLP
ncbi:S8 family serine peptidase [Nocardioides guangzhouensis]|nr:S8 family serine peptidase [Nocardioides guangzhouensis]